MNKKNLMRGIAIVAVIPLLGTMAIAVTTPKDAFAPLGIRFVLLWLLQVTTYM